MKQENMTYWCIKYEDGSYQKGFQSSMPALYMSEGNANRYNTFNGKVIEVRIKEIVRRGSRVIEVSNDDTGEVE